MEKPQEDRNFFILFIVECACAIIYSNSPLISSGLREKLEVPRATFPSFRLVLSPNSWRSISVIGYDSTSHTKEKVTLCLSFSLSFSLSLFRSLLYSHTYSSKKTGETVGDFKAEIIGTVEKCYRFSGMFASLSERRERATIDGEKREAREWRAEKREERGERRESHFPLFFFEKEWLTFRLLRLRLVLDSISVG